MSLSRPFALVLALALAAPTAAPVLAQDQDTDSIVVTAPRHGKRNASNQPIETVTHSTRVSTAGLDLSSPAGIQALESRVHVAAKASCKWLDDNYPVVDDEGDCEAAAVSDAMRRARDMAAKR